MTLNLAQLRERVAARFPHVEQVDDSVIRFTRDAGKEPFAVYYFDIAQDLPQTQETLTKYQDRVIGTHYFEGKTSLQWSNYLYFVTSGERLASSEVRRAKELIERDRSYARKFVITEAGDRILYFLRIYVCRLQRLLRPIGGKETVQSVKVLLPALRGVDSGLLQIVGAHQVLGGLSREGFGNGHRRKKYSDH